MKLAYSGRYRLVVEHGLTDEVLHDTGWFDNLITNAGLDMMADNFAAYIHLGSGSNPATHADTAIQTPLVSNGSMGVYTYGLQRTTEPYYGYKIYYITYGIGQVSGTIRELGIGPSNSNLFSRALLKDENGNATSLTVGGIDRLTVYYEYRQHIPLDDVVTNVVIAGTTRETISRAANANRYIWTPSLGTGIFIQNWGGGNQVAAGLNGTYPYIGTTTGNWSCTSARANDGYSNTAYTPGSHTRQFSFIWNQDYVLDSVSAVSWFQFHSLDASSAGGAWQLSIHPPVYKGVLERLTLNGQFTWGRME